MFLSGQRDADFIILSELNDKDLLSVCLTNNYANRLCNSEDFWRNRFIVKWRLDDMKYKDNNRSWKNFYLLIVKYLNGGKDWNSALINATKDGYQDLVEFFISKGGNFIRKFPETQWDTGMFSAARGGHQDLVEFFISKGADDLNSGMFYAAEGGHRGLVDFFINKGADNWNMGIEGATKGGHRDLVEFFISKGARISKPIKIENDTIYYI